MLVQTIELWDDLPHVTLTAYLPNILNKDKDKPAIIICPGGAYLYTSEREAEPVALRFASLGYPTFVLHYNTYYGKGPIDKLHPPAPNPNSLYPQPLKDVAKAVSIVREQSSTMNIDPDKIVVAGFSAGGHLAAMLGVHWNKPYLADLMGMKNEAFRPNALLLGYALLDSKLSKDLMTVEEKIKFSEMFDLMYQALFAKQEILDDELIKFSPALLVDEHTPPTFLWHTAEDDLVKSANSLQFALGLAKHGINYELHVFEKGGHGLSLGDITTSLAPEQINADAAQWVGLAAKWLERQF